MLCPACNQPPSDPVVRPHATFCGPCWSVVRPDAHHQHYRRPGTLAPVPAGFLPIPGHPAYAARDDGRAVSVVSLRGRPRVLKLHAGRRYTLLAPDGRQVHLTPGAVRRLIT